MIAAPAPGVGISARCLLIGAPLTSILWVLLALTLLVRTAPAPATMRERAIHTCTSHAAPWAQADCWTAAKDARHG